MASICRVCCMVGSRLIVLLTTLEADSGQIIFSTLCQPGEARYLSVAVLRAVMTLPTRLGVARTGECL